MFKYENRRIFIDIMIRGYNIKDTTLVQIYRSLEEVFGEGNVVIIGGRAVNIYCSKNKRNTEDIDIVVKTDLSSEELNKKLNENGFLPENVGEKDSTQYIYKGSGIKIDFYILKPGKEENERLI